MSTPKVIIAGGGIAGPVLALFLKLRGYAPVIYERNDGPSDMGLSLAFQPNGLRVLDLIPGLVDRIVSHPIEELVSYSALPGEERELARFRQNLREVCGKGPEGVRRPLLLRTLVDVAREHGIPFHFGHQLVELEQRDDSVTVKFANGATDKGSFVVGCDGLHSNTRICLFGREQASFTGLTQTGGISPIPESIASRGIYPIFNIYGDGFHMVGYPINKSEISWAITQREPEEKETWREMDENRQKEFKEGPFSKLPFSGGELVRTANNVVKYGLYDRPELKSWHKGRVVLIGDAAHPTSPHLGQGANQAFEDIYHLVRLLLKHNPDSSSPSTEVLSSAFTEFEQLRIPRTSALVSEARRQGELRVVSGVEECKKRDEVMSRMIEAFAEGARDPATAKGLYADLLQQPFAPGQSEI